MHHIYRDPAFDSFYVDRSKDYQKRDFAYNLIKLIDPDLKSTLIDALDYKAFKESPDYGKQVAIISAPMSNTGIPDDLIEYTSVSMYGMWYAPYKIENKPVIRQYNCFNNRMDALRQSWMYALHRRNMIDEGFVSFNVDTERVSYLHGMTTLEAFDYHYKTHFQIFEKEHQELRTQVPFKNFIETGNLADTILRSGVSICLETYSTDNNVISLSEKIFRNLQIPRPWLLFCSAGSIQHLRDIGMDVLDDIVDHSYDNMSSPIDRQVAILNTCQDMYDLNIDAIFPRLAEAAKHNQNILSNWLQTWEEDLIITIANAKKKVDKIKNNELR